jgi:hypothetical protein
VTTLFAIAIAADLLLRIGIIAWVLIKSHAIDAQKPRTAITHTPIL